jgi:hypothetical protein
MLDLDHRLLSIDGIHTDHVNVLLGILKQNSLLVNDLIEQQQQDEYVYEC